MNILQLIPFAPHIQWSFSRNTISNNKTKNIVCFSYKESLALPKKWICLFYSESRLRRYPKRKLLWIEISPTELK